MKRNIFSPLLSISSSDSITFLLYQIDTTDIGNELIPAVDNVNTFDTILDVVTDNFLFNDTYAGYAVQRGSCTWVYIENDPEFGKTDAAIYFDVSPGMLWYISFW